MGIFYCLPVYWRKDLPQLNVKGVHTLKTKSSGIILAPWAVFVPISAFLLFLVFNVAVARMHSLLLAFWPIFGVFCQFCDTCQIWCS